MLEMQEFIEEIPREKAYVTGIITSIPFHSIYGITIALH